MLNSKSSELTEVKNKGTRKKRQANKIEIAFRKKLSSFTLKSITEDGKIRYCFRGLVQLKNRAPCCILQNYMSRFKELDDLLRAKQASHEDLLNASLVNATESRRKHDLAIRTAFSIFGDYYATILQPRIPFQILTRKKDWPTSKDLEESYQERPFYAYVINLVSPAERRPFGFEHAEGLCPGWLEPDITEDNGWSRWYPMSAMQFAVLLSPEYLIEEERLSDELELIVHIRVWGSVDPGDKSLLPPNMSIHRYDGGWFETATDITISYKEMESFKNSIQQSLELLTSNVLGHKEIIEV